MDKFYEPLKGTNDLLKAGWIDDGLTELQRQQLWNPNVLTTPVYKLTTPQTKSPVVLLSTGGFGPIHEGHLEMMSLAKQALEKSGREVCGGYLSPSHDSYILNKYSETHNLSDRLWNLEKKLMNHPWLMVDPWEGLWTPQAINFTEVYQRLEVYLQQWFHPDVKVVYVFGSDNQYFLKAFSQEGLAVCVQRQESLAVDLEKIIDSKRLWFVKNNLCENFSSRALPRIVRPESKGKYLLRNDLPWAYPDFKEEEKLIKIFEKYFSNFKIEILPPPPAINFSQVISLDPWVRGINNLDITRKFTLSGGQVHGQELISRIERPESLLEQWNQIPSGQYSLLDDDIASGQTIKFISSSAPPRIKINEVGSLVEKTLGNSPKFADIVDLRDFLWGANYGGLTVELPNGELSRVPYLLPWVQLDFRASLPAQDGLKFSLEILELNLEIHQKTAIKDLPVAQQNLFYFLGLKPQSLLALFLEEHILQINRVLKKTT